MHAILVIFKKDFRAFAGSLVGLIVFVLFSVISGLFNWVFADSSVLDNGYATLNTFFDYTPFILMFLVPAISMRLFSEEFREGTIDLLLSKPLGIKNLVLGKYLSIVAVAVLMLLPVLVYFVSIYLLGSPVGNIDVSSSLGSFFGLILLVGLFGAIGLCASALTENQIVAFVLGVFVCFLVWLGLDYASQLFSGNLAYVIQNFSASTHYNALSRGLIDSRNLVYFISFSAVFLFVTFGRLKKRLS